METHVKHDQLKVSTNQFAGDTASSSVTCCCVYVRSLVACYPGFQPKHLVLAYHTILGILREKHLIAPLQRSLQILHWDFSPAKIKNRIVQDSSGTGSSLSGVANHGMMSTRGASLVEGSPSLNPRYPCGSVYTGVWRFAAPMEYVTALREDSAYGGRLQFRCWSEFMQYFCVSRAVTRYSSSLGSRCQL